MAEKVETGLKKLSEADIEKAVLRWWLTSHMAYNYQRMQAGGFATMMGPLLKKLYHDNPAEIIAGLKRHMMFFNTEPRWGSVIHGVTIALEEQRANGQDYISEESIVDMKSSLMGPMAGIGDTITQALFKPILVSLCIGWAMTGNYLGPAVFAIVGLSFDFFVTRYSLKFGYKLGTEAVIKLLEGGLFKNLTTFFSILGLFVVGVMICKFITVDIAYEPVIAGKKIAVKGLLDQIVPKTLPLLLTIISWRAIMKGYRVVHVLLCLFAFALAGGALGFIK